MLQRHLRAAHVVLPLLAEVLAVYEGKQDARLVGSGRRQNAGRVERPPASLRN